MIKKLLKISMTLALAGSSAMAFAEGNAQTGKTQAASCAGCHGEDGNSMMPTFPKLAGQHELYLVKQLQAFKNGSRNAPMMAPLAMGLSDEEMQNIAAYYADQKISANAMPVLQPEEDEDDLSEEEQKEAEANRTEQMKNYMAKGGDLYRNGDLEREVSACIACHGPYGEGNKPAAFPALHAQHADYLIKSLTDYKQGARQNNRENMMHMIATKMTDEQIKAVSYYMSMMK